VDPKSDGIIIVVIFAVDVDVESVSLSGHISMKEAEAHLMTHDLDDHKAVAHSLLS